MKVFKLVKKEIKKILQDSKKMKGSKEKRIASCDTIGTSETCNCYFHTFTKYLLYKAPHRLATPAFLSFLCKNSSIIIWQNYTRKG